MGELYQRLAAFALPWLVSCAPLVSYEGFRGGEEAETDAGLDAGREAAPSDGGFDACRAAVPGAYCGRVLPGYSGGTQDLVRCLGDGTTGSITPCTAGCSSMPNGRQDACNPCAGRDDGVYCMHELLVDYPGNDVIVTCGAAAVTASARCPLVCTTSACR